MGTLIRINVYQGDRIEVLPAKCMFCGQSLGEEPYQPVRMQLGDTIRPLALPICRTDKIPDQALQPDGENDPVPGVNPQRYAPYLVGTFAFPNVDARFAQELEGLRNLPHDQYDQQFAQGNARIQAMLQGRQMAPMESEDEAAFRLEQLAAPGEVTRAETRASSRKLIFISLIAAAVGLLLVMCITVGIFTYSLVAAKSAKEDEARHLEADPPKELRALIKSIDRDRHTIQIRRNPAGIQVYKIDDKTEFRDRDGAILPTGLADPKIREEEYCVILPTPDRRALQWLKLTPPPK